MPVGLQEYVEPQLVQRCAAPVRAGASVVERLLLQLRQHVGIVTEQQPGAGSFDQVLREPVAPPPGGMVAEQPSQRSALLVVVAKMKLVAGQEERARVRKLQPQAHQSGGMPRKPMKVEPFEQLDVIAVDGLPVEGEIEVVRQVRTDVLARGNGVERVPQLVRMDVDGNVSATKELEASPVVEVEVREHDRSDIAEAVAGSADHGVEPVFVSVVSYREQLEDHRRPQFPGVGRSSCVIQNGTDLGMVDEGADDGDLTAGGRGAPC